MNIKGVQIQDTFAEAFPMVAARAIVTADSPRWAMTAAQVATGYATSVIGCDAEVGIERTVSPEESPDGRPGIAILAFAFSRDKLAKALMNRVAQCVMTAPTTACYNGIEPGEKPIDIGGQLRYFGDGDQISKLIDGRRYWRIPVMDGEFTCEHQFNTVKGVAGGNFLILAKTPAAGLIAAETAVEAIRKLPDVILPFPGGVVRSGSKVGSKYKNLVASTNSPYCPTLRGRNDSALSDDVNAVYEIVIDGLNEEAVKTATRIGIEAACIDGVVKITAGNYGGQLGPHHIKLHEVLAG